MKIILSMLSIFLLLGGCTSANVAQTDHSKEIRTLPVKQVPESGLQNDSPINATNIDQYLFIEDVIYVDLRDSQQLLTEGSIAGFINIPFYNVLVSYEPSENVLFSMNRKYSDNNAVLGDEGTYKATYEESEWLLNQVFPKDQPIVLMSTAGVESAYMIGLLKQYGYNPSLLYNAGTFTNGMGDTIAYKDYENHQHYIEPNAIYTVTTTFDWGELTPIE